MLSVLDEPVSLAAVRSGTDNAGGMVSIVTDNAPELALAFPAASEARAAMLCTPSAKALEVIVQVPPAVAVALPTTVPPSSSSTSEPATAVPVKVGVVTLVMLSVDELPLSLAAVKSGVPGAAGGVVSIVIVNAADVAPVLPATSVARAEKLWAPVASTVFTVIIQTPELSATPVPRVVVPSSNVTVAPGSVVPVKVGEVFFVRLSVLDDPVSVAAVRSGAEGAAGGVVSIVATKVFEAALVFPATSVAVAM